MSEVSPEIAVIGGGCFWCLEAVFELIRGVELVESGYCGGQTLNPTYRAVCSGNTGHAEVIRITFNPTIVTFRELLEVFFATHDPTTLNRQGHDVGTQYRSAIFYQNKVQRETAQAIISEFSEKSVFDRAIVTEVTAAATFYKAEDYHQGYYRANGQEGYCQLVVSPKVAKTRAAFRDKLK